MGRLAVMVSDPARVGGLNHHVTTIIGLAEGMLRDKIPGILCAAICRTERGAGPSRLSMLNVGAVITRHSETVHH